MKNRRLLSFCARRGGFALPLLGAALLAGGAMQPAHAAVNEFVIGLVSSGTAPFDGTSGAGLDMGPGDTAVRSNDQFTYRVGYSLAPADTDRLVTLSMGATAIPAGYTGPALAAEQIAYYAVADLPSGAGGCANISTSPVPWPPAAGTTTSGVSADGQHIVCYQPGAQSGANMDFIARVGGAAPNGTTVAPPAVTFQSANNTGSYAPTPISGTFGSTTLYGTPTLAVSAAPRWLVKKSPAGGGSVFVPGSGPAGEDGVIAPFNIGVYAAGSRKGLEALAPGYTIAESFNDPDMPNALLVTWDISVPGFATVPMGPGTEPTNQNGCGDWRNQLLRLGGVFDNLAYQAGDSGATASSAATWVARGGTCMASAVDNTAKTATLNLSGTDFSLTHYPTLRGTIGGLLVNTSDLEAPGNEWWVASKSVLIWVPVDDLTPNTTEYLTNTATLSGTSVTGQTNPPSSSSADAGVLRQIGGSHSKIYSAASAAWQAAALASEPLAVCDPNVSGDCWVNQAAPGQLLASRVNSSARTSSFSDGIICEKLDNARFTLADLRGIPTARASDVKDAGTGIVVRYLAGSPAASPLTFELGVGGNHTSAGTWATRSNVPTEYHAPNPATNAGDQALATCHDADATWYASIDDLLAAGRSLGEVTRVRARYASYAAATQTLIYVPLRVNDVYAYSATETGGTTPTITAGESTVDSYAPNHSIWETGAGQTLKGVDALRITQTEYVQISKSALAPHAIGGGQVMRGALVEYRLRVNLTSSTNAHTAPSVTIWDVLPEHVDYVPGSSRFGGAPIADPACEAPGVTPAAPAPFDAGSVAPGFKACHWTLADQPVALAAIGAAAGELPALDFRAVVAVDAPAGANLLNTSFADSPDNLLRDALYSSPAGATSASFRCVDTVNCSYGNWNLIVSSATGIVADKAVSTAVVTPDTGFAYALTYSSVGTTLANLRVLDVLPSPADGRSSAYGGTLRLTGPIAAPVAAAGPPVLLADPDLVVRYTVNAPGSINRDPYHAGHDTAGTGTNSATTTNWCTAAQIGTANCPADWAAVTAFMAFPRAAAGGVIGAGESYQLQVPVLPAGNAPDDVYLNDYVADSPSLTARRPGSNTVVTTVTGIGVPAQTVSGRVYREASAPANTSDDGHAIDPGLAGVVVRLACTSPAYDQSTTTGADGSFSFSGVTSGADCTLTQTQPAGYENAYNVPGAGGTGQTGDTGTGDSTITLAVPYGGSTGNLFAETAPAGADMVSSVTCSPDPAAGGEVVSCAVTCTNQGSVAAVDALCSVVNASSLPGAPAPVCSPPGVVAPGQSLSCSIDFTMPNTTTPVDVLAGTGAVNDDDGGLDPSAGNNPSSTQVTPAAVAALAPIPALGWPALVLLGALLGAVGVRRGSTR